MAYQPTALQSLCIAQRTSHKLGEGYTSCILVEGARGCALEHAHSLSCPRDAALSVALHVSCEAYSCSVVAQGLLDKRRRQRKRCLRARLLIYTRADVTPLPPAGSARKRLYVDNRRVCSDIEGECAAAETSCRSSKAFATCHVECPPGIVYVVFAASTTPRALAKSARCNE